MYQTRSRHPNQKKRRGEEKEKREKIISMLAPADINDKQKPPVVVEGEAVAVAVEPAAATAAATSAVPLGPDAEVIECRGCGRQFQPAPGSKPGSAAYYRCPNCVKDTQQDFLCVYLTCGLSTLLPKKCCTIM